MSRIEKALERAVHLRTGRPLHPLRERILPAVPDDGDGEPFLPGNSRIVSPRDERTPAAEQYRKLKTVVMKLTQEEFRNVIMVTSSLSGEGKSVTAVNLAITLAQELNRTVLLVDADLRRPVLRSYLNVPASPGLTDCLSEGVDASAAIVRTGVPKLRFLGPGKSVRNPVELLSSHRMQELLGELKHRYRDRYVIIDTPPVLPFAETHALCTMVDGVLLVVREGAASMQGISDAMESLRGASVLGIVYNDASAAGLISRYGYYAGDYTPRKDA